MSSTLRDKELQLAAALEAKATAEAEAQKNATAIDALSTESAAKIRSYRESLEASESAMSTMKAANAALEKRAHDAESRVVQASEVKEASEHAQSEAAAEVARMVGARQEAESALAEAQAEVGELRERIRQMVEHHTDHEAQALVDAEDAAELREENARLQQELATRGEQLEGERQRRAEAAEEAKAARMEAERAKEEAERDAAERAASTALVTLRAEADDDEEVLFTSRMREQRERVQSLQAQLTGRGGGRPRGAGGFFGDAWLKGLSGGLSGTMCLGAERKALRSNDGEHTTHSTPPSRNARSAREIGASPADEQRHQRHHHNPLSSANLFWRERTAAPPSRSAPSRASPRAPADARRINRHHRLDAFLASPRVAAEVRRRQDTHISPGERAADRRDSRSAGPRGGVRAAGHHAHTPTQRTQHHERECDALDGAHSPSAPVRLHSRSHHQVHASKRDIRAAVSPAGNAKRRPPGQANKAVNGDHPRARVRNGEGYGYA